MARLNLDLTQVLPEGPLYELYTQPETLPFKAKGLYLTNLTSRFHLLRQVKFGLTKFTTILDFLIEYPERGWNWYDVSRNPGVTVEFVESHPRSSIVAIWGKKLYIWDWDCLFIALCAINKPGFKSRSDLKPWGRFIFKSKSNSSFYRGT